jgi:DNA-binding IclR family transcriptional regulator
MKKVSSANGAATTGNAGKRSPVKSLVKALRILDIIGASEEGLGITAMSRVLKTPKSTVHRLLTTLKTEGYIGVHPGTSQYILGSRVAKWGDQLRNQSPLLRFGVPILEGVTHQCGETSYLGTMEGTVATMLARVESKALLRISIGMGYHTPLHCTAVGKACLSGLPDAQIARIFKNRKALPRFTPNTITNLEALLTELVTVRREGVALDDEEWFADVRCIAAPVMDISGRVIAALSIATTKRRMTAEKRAFFKGILIRATSELSEQIASTWAGGKAAISDKTPAMAGYPHSGANLLTMAGLEAGIER